MSYNSNNYTRCEKCKHIDRKNEKCKITNDNWLVSDRAGTCHQFEGVESMKVRCIDENLKNLIKGNEYLVVNYTNNAYKVINEKQIPTYYYKKFFEIVEEELESKNKKNFKKGDWVKIVNKEIADLLNVDLKNEFKVLRVEIFSVRVYVNSKLGFVWINNRDIEKAEEKNEKLEENLHEKLSKEFEGNVKKGAEMLAKCSMSSIDMKNGSNVSHPSHYNKGIEAIEYIESWDMNFNIGNVIKYVSRAKYKGKELEDLQKAAWYLAKEIERVKAND